jgi:hypothetical protein
MGRHDPSVMADPHGQAEAFGQLVAIEQELLQLLKNKLEEDEALLGA